jgi:hypothetical protein
MSCHYYHLIPLLRIGKPSDPLKGDAHEENTFRSYKLSDRDLHVLPAHKEKREKQTPILNGGKYGSY